MKVVIIGGVAGGASAAARLRRLDESAEIVIIERGEYVSFANCGLPYYVGGAIRDRSALTLQTPESFKKRFNIEVRTLSEATEADAAARTVSVKNIREGTEYTESYDRLIIATGAEPILPPVPGTDLPGVFTLRTIPDAVRIRSAAENLKSGWAVIVGGGAIGLEMAENLAANGLEVAIIEAGEHLFPALDSEMAADLHHHARENGVELYLNRPLESVARGEKRLELSAGGEATEADIVLISVGARPESALARSAGIAVNEKGEIITDRNMRTSDPAIYAVGDVTEGRSAITGGRGRFMLAGPANRQGRVAADSICGIPSAYGGSLGSAVVKFFGMTAAVTGLSEYAARAAGFDCDKSYTFSPSHASYYPGARSMSVKTVFEKGSGRVLGAQIVGFGGVSKRCDVFASAIRMGLTVGGLTELELCYAPPFSSAKDPVNMAGYVAENILNGLVKTFHWHDVDSLPRDGTVTLLDVRTPSEYGSGRIDGFVNIPLDVLRERAGELDASKPCYVHCLSGQRSYIACRMLAARGFDCYNLSGGYRLYGSVKKDAKRRESRQ